MKHRILLGALLFTMLGTDVSAQNRTHRRRGIIFGGIAGAALGVAIGDKGNNEAAGAIIGAAAGAFAGAAIGNQKDQLIEQEMRFQTDRYGHGTFGYPAQIHSHSRLHRSTPDLHQQKAPPPNYAHSNRTLFQGHPQPPTGMMPPYNQPYVYSQGRRYLAEPGPEPAVSNLENQYQHQTPQPMMSENRRSGRRLEIKDILAMTRSGISQSLLLRQIETHGFKGQLNVPDIIALHKIGIPDEILEAMQIHGDHQPQSNANVIKPDSHQPLPTAASEMLLPPPPTESR